MVNGVSRDVDPKITDPNFMKSTPVPVMPICHPIFQLDGKNYIAGDDGPIETEDYHYNILIVRKEAPDELPEHVCAVNIADIIGLLGLSIHHDGYFQSRFAKNGSSYGLDDPIVITRALNVCVISMTYRLRLDVPVFRTLDQTITTLSAQHSVRVNWRRSETLFFYSKNEYDSLTGEDDYGRRFSGFGLVGVLERIPGLYEIAESSCFALSPGIGLAIFDDILKIPIGFGNYTIPIFRYVLPVTSILCSGRFNVPTVFQRMMTDEGNYVQFEYDPKNFEMNKVCAAMLSQAGAENDFGQDQ